MKIYHVGVELFHADRQQDRQAGRHDEANSHFLQFRERTQKYLLYSKSVHHHYEVTAMKFSSL
jgi:hypothetical protein